MMLHIINKSPRSHACFNDCLTLCADGSSMLFIEDGVYAASCLSAEQYQQLSQKQITLYALKADLLARGIHEQADQRFEQITDTEFVELTVTHHSSQSWY